MPDPSDPTETACVTAAVFFPLVVRAAASANATPVAGAAGSPCTDPDGNQGITVQILGAPEIQWTQNGTTSTISVIDDGSGTEPKAQPVVVGQQIKLKTKPDADKLAALGLAFSENKWTVGGTRIKDYVPTTASAKVKELTDDDLEKADITFYWVYTKDNNIPVTYKYCVDIPGADADGKCSLVAKAAFKVTGPGDAQMTTDPYSAVMINTIVDRQPCLPGDTDFLLQYGIVTGYDNGKCPGQGGETGTPGVKFTPPSASSSGTYSFAQLVTKDTTTYTEGKNGSLSCPTNPGYDGALGYPIPQYADGTTSDSPSVLLEPFYSRIRRTFKATMYLLWTSSIPNSISVPISSQSWQFTQAISANSSYPSGQSWTQPVWNLIGTDGDPVDYVQTAPSASPYGYPTWTGPATPVVHSICPTQNSEEEEQ